MQLDHAIWYVRWPSEVPAGITPLGPDRPLAKQAFF